MAEYINREKIFPNGVFYVNNNNPMASLDELINRICNLPTEDVVPVVRCGQCKHFIPDKDLDHIEYPNELEADGLCDNADKYANADHFCSYGERKEENGKL